MRLLCVGAFAVSGYSSTEGRTCKPFNPLLGETYEADYPDKGLKFFSEKVCHHRYCMLCDTFRTYLMNVPSTLVFESESCVCESWRC